MDIHEYGEMDDPVVCPLCSDIVESRELINKQRDLGMSICARCNELRAMEWRWCSLTKDLILTGGWRTIESGGLITCSNS